MNHKIQAIIERAAQDYHADHFDWVRAMKEWLDSEEAAPKPKEPFLRDYILRAVREVIGESRVHESLVEMTEQYAFARSLLVPNQDDSPLLEKARAALRTLKELHQSAPTKDTR